MHLLSLNLNHFSLMAKNYQWPIYQLSTDYKAAINNFATAQRRKSPKAILLIKPKTIFSAHAV